MNTAENIVVPYNPCTVCYRACVPVSMRVHLYVAVRLGTALVRTDLAIMVLLSEVGEGLKALLAAYLISPYGIPMAATCLIDTVDGLNERLKAI